jgi:hypothetical protein
LNDVAAGSEWDKPILGRRIAVAVGRNQAKPGRRFWTGAFIGFVIGAGMSAVAALVWLGGPSGLKAAARHSSGNLATVPAGSQSPVAKAGVAVAAYEALMRLAVSESDDATVEAMFQRYILTSNGLAETIQDQSSTDIAALGTGQAGAMDLLYLQPLKLAALHMDECAARVIAARMANPGDPPMKAQTASLTMDLCRGRGPLDGLGPDGFASMVRRCTRGIEDSLEAARASRFDAAGLQVAAGLAGSQKPALCPPATTFIRATPSSPAKANP